MLLSRSITSGPRWGKTSAWTRNDLLPDFSVKQTYTRILRGEPLALRSDIAPGGTGKMRFCRNFSCLSMNVFDMHGMSVAESICCVLQEHLVSEPLWMGNVSSRRKHQVHPVKNASRNLKKNHDISSRPSLPLAVADACYF